jgi:hypothetical protein
MITPSDQERLQGGKTIQQRSGFALPWYLMLLPVLWLMPLRIGCCALVLSFLLCSDGNLIWKTSPKERVQSVFILWKLVAGGAFVACCREFPKSPESRDYRLLYFELASSTASQPQHLFVVNNEIKLVFNPSFFSIFSQFKGETLELSITIVYSDNNVQQACLLNLDNLTDQPL